LFRWSWEVEDTFNKGISRSFIDLFHNFRFLKYLVAKGQKMAMKNYAKQLNAQIEEVVAEVKAKRFFFLFLSNFLYFRFVIH